VPAADKLIGEVSRWQVQNAEKNGTQINYTLVIGSGHGQHNLPKSGSHHLLLQRLILLNFQQLTFSK